MMPAIVQYDGFTIPQRRYIERSANSWLNVAEGSKRAGKNIINLIAWSQAIETHPDRLHLAAGVSQSAVKMNIIDSDGFGLQWLFYGRCKLGKYNGRDALIVRTKTGEKAIIIAGGRDVASASMIKGHSYGSAYITEVNECHKTFFQEVMDRTLASGRRQLFFDLNPKPPAHWFYSEFLDYQDELKEQGKNPRYNYGHFTIADNLSISRDALRDMLQKYDRSSIWYQRDILGKRTSASGRIYTSYKYDDVSLDPKEIANMRFVDLSVGVDVGGTDATVATLTGLTPGWKSAVLIDGMYHKQGIDNRMDSSMYAKMIVQWLKPWTKIYPIIGTIYVDSANKLFIQDLRHELDRNGLQRFIVKGFNKSDGILERIELENMLLYTGRLKISSRLVKWHEAFQMAVWSDEDFEKGDWVRVDDGSYPVDCLDSTEYSLYPFKNYMIG